MLDLESLNDAQQNAVMYGSGALLVLAGPGSGKTYTITQRIFYLLEREHVPPENILVITFTKDAAFSMQSRFRQLSNQIYPVNFGTFHSVFYHIIRESHLLNSGQILTEEQKRKLIIPIIKKYITKEEIEYIQNHISDEAISILSGISYFKNTGALEETIQRLPEQWKPYFPKIMEEYEKERRKVRVLDFDDMVFECRRLLSQNKGLRDYWQKRFSHILIDEFQDINPMQYEVIRLLVKKPYNLFAVGDDDQSIYGFRGAKPYCLRRFVEEYQAKQVCLNINYRSRCEIIEASLMMIGANTERFVKKFKASPENEQKRYDSNRAVILRAFEEREQQYEYLISKLQKSGQNGQIGVLFRTNSYMQGLASRLSKEGIPYTMKEKVKSIYEHFIVKDIMAYIRIAEGEKKQSSLLLVLNKPSRYVSREALSGQEEWDFGKMKEYYRLKGLDSQNIQVIQNIEKLEKQMYYLKGKTPFLAVQYIRKVIGYDTYLQKKARTGSNQWQEWEELLSWLSMDAAGYETISEWLVAQENYKNALEQTKQEQGEQRAAISLMTVHASKGLEFDKVYIPDCNEKIFPHGNMPDREACEEERRIFYVAMTRAKESLELLYLTGTKERPRLPSRFLNELLRNYSSTSSSNSQLSKYSSKASATFSYSASSSMYSNSGSSLGSSGFSE